MTKRALDDRRSRRKDLAFALDHDRPVTEDGACGRTARNCSHHGADDRHDTHQINRAFKTILAVAGNYGKAFPARGVHRPARAFDQIDQRYAVFVREILDEAALTA